MLTLQFIVPPARLLGGSASACSRAQPGSLQLGLTRAVIAPSQPGQLGLGRPSGISQESAPRSERPHRASSRRRRRRQLVPVSNHAWCRRAPRCRGGQVLLLVWLSRGRPVACDSFRSRLVPSGGTICYLGSQSMCHWPRVGQDRGGGAGGGASLGVFSLTCTAPLPPKVDGV